MLWQGDRVKSDKGISRSLATQRKPVKVDPFPGVTEWARDMRKTIDEVAATDAHILIVGEKGTEYVLLLYFWPVRNLWFSAVYPRAP